MTNPITKSRSWRLAGTAAGLTVLLGLAAACGSSSAGTTSATSAAPTTADESGRSPGGRNGQTQNRSAADGMIASVKGSVLQVQSTDRQTTVNFSGSTTITASNTADLSAVTAGLCITAAAIPAGGASASGEAAPSALPSASADEPFTATMIQLSDPENGQCSMGFPGGGAPPSAGAIPSGGAFPSDGAVPGGAMPSGGAVPSGVPQGGLGGFGNRASGTVASVSGDSIVISETDPTSQAVTERTVTVDSTTTYTKRAAATTAALVVGQCAVVQGSTDSKGAVTATSIAVSAPTGSTCTTGFGGPGGFGGGRGQGGNAPTTSGG